MARRAPTKCPICAKPAEQRFRPFCSRRCADIDLGRWFLGSYAVPAVEPPDEFDYDDLGDPEREKRDDDGLLH